MDDLERFVAGYGVGGLRHVADTDNSVWDRYGVFSQPVFAFINDDGAIEVTRVSISELPNRIDELLAA